MNPNLMDCWIGSSLTELHFRNLVAEIHREQFIDHHCPVAKNPWHVPTAIRRQVGSLLVRAGQRLLGAPAGTEPGVGVRPVAVA